MTGPAVLLMLAFIVIVWGGLALSVASLVSRGRREAREARAASRSAAREHLHTAVPHEAVQDGTATQD